MEPLIDVQATQHRIRGGYVWGTVPHGCQALKSHGTLSRSSSLLALVSKPLWPRGWGAMLAEWGEGDQAGVPERARADWPGAAAGFLWPC